MAGIALSLNTTLAWPRRMYCTVQARPRTVATIGFSSSSTLTRACSFVYKACERRVEIQHFKIHTCQVSVIGTVGVRHSAEVQRVYV